MRVKGRKQEKKNNKKTSTSCGNVEPCTQSKSKQLLVYQVYSGGEKSRQSTYSVCPQLQRVAEIKDKRARRLQFRAPSVTYLETPTEQTNGSSLDGSPPQAQSVVSLRASALTRSWAGKTSNFKWSTGNTKRGAELTTYSTPPIHWSSTVASGCFIGQLTHYTLHTFKALPLHLAP